eukprot:1208238-Rhodomonas_salina.3
MPRSDARVRHRRVGGSTSRCGCRRERCRSGLHSVPTHLYHSLRQYLYYGMGSITRTVSTKRVLHQVRSRIGQLYLARAAVEGLDLVAP